VTSELQVLRALGHQVHVESIWPADHPNPEAAAGIDVAFASEDGRRARLSALAWLVRRHPLRVLADLLRRRRWRREEDVRSLRALAPAVRRIAAHASTHVHAQFAAGAALDAMRGARLLGIPYSVATHGYDIFQFPANLRDKHRRAAFAVSACNYSVAHLQDELGPEIGARISRLVVGIDGERFRRSRPHPGGRTVVAVARLVEKKGLGYLIEATALMRWHGSDLRVRIAGAGPLREQLTTLIRELGVEDVVELLGPLTPEQVRELLEDADLLAAPCVIADDGDRDTMPVVVKEALAMELPVVASDEVGLPEIVRPEWGRLVPPGDPQALADAIDELLALPPEERIAMGRAGRAFVLEECSLERETARLADMIAAASVRQ
jgi:colanic acid/amylovoran biosynthesis glycosyltransferase